MEIPRIEGGTWLAGAAAAPAWAARTCSFARIPSSLLSLTGTRDLLRFPGMGGQPRPNTLSSAVPPLSQRHLTFIGAHAVSPAKG